MYEQFFSLEDSPFVLTPDPRFLLRSKSHHEVLSSLLYGITSQKGLMALIGDVGTGKTTLCRALLRELPHGVQSALVLNPHLSDAELVGAILDDLGLERRGATKGELMGVLSQHLLAAGAEGKTVVVILDEAQQMSVPALEQIRILSTLETPTRKLLQIILAGQPELEERLAGRELRQLDQRIAIRCHLEPLSRRDTHRYVEHRLRIAGLPGELPFTRAALNRIYDYSRGIPRVINLVCDRALLAAFSARAREIGPGLVKAAIRSLEGDRRRRRAALDPARGHGRRKRALAAGLAALALLGTGAAGLYLVPRGTWSRLASAVPAWPSRPAPELVSSAPPSPPAPAGLDATRPANGPVSAPGPAPLTASERPAAVAVAMPSPTPEATAAGPRSEPGAVQDGVRGLLVQTLGLWGVNDRLSEDAVRSWPVGPDGSPKMEAVAERYQLTATFLPSTTLAELRGIGLPALIELSESSRKRVYLVRRIEGPVIALLNPAGEEVRLPVERFESTWTHAAWVLWRNIDFLPADAKLSMTPTVLATLALRLQKLGYLQPPLPAAHGERFEQAVRRFQRDAGLPEDGIVGPRTTLALARIVGGRFSPTIVQDAPR
jgi:general secretion pathway protein A